MNQRYQWLAMVALVTCLVGCNTCRPGLFSNIGAARIAPPATGTVQFPQVAQVPAPYYTPTASTQPSIAPNVNTQQGWRPAGVSPAQPQSRAYNPTSYNIPGPNQFVQVPANNLQIASNTTSLRPTAGVPRIAAQPAISTSTTQINSAPAFAGGMPLTDATRMANVPQTGNRGLFNRTWEYVVRPSVPQNQGQIVGAISQPNVGNSVLATGTSAPGFTGPRLNTATGGYVQGSYPAGYRPGLNYPNNAYPGNTVADGWRQRNGIAR